METSRNIVNALISGDKVAAQDLTNAAIKQQTLAQVDNVKHDIQQNPWMTPTQASNQQGGE